MSEQTMRQSVCAGWGHTWVTYGDPTTNTVDTRCSHCDLLMTLTTEEVREYMAEYEPLALEAAFVRWMRAFDKNKTSEVRGRIVELLEDLKHTPVQTPENETWNFAIEDAITTITREIR